MNNVILSILGVVYLVLANVGITPASFDDVYIGWGGIDRLSPSHTKNIVNAYQCDNYITDSKEEENPRYTTLSVRPGESTYLNDAGGAVRGLFQFSTPAGTDTLIMADTDTLYKSSGTLWATLEAGYSNAPWEGELYSDPKVTRLYLCNGFDGSRKYLSEKNISYAMQDQDNEVALVGNVYLVKNSLVATADASATSGLKAGHYIKYATAGTDDDWNEIVSTESTNITFNTPYTGTSAAFSSAVRSTDQLSSRYIVEYKGHIVMGSSKSESVKVSSTLGTEYFNLKNAYGVAQSFEATSSSLDKIRMTIYRTAEGTVGNIVIKIKETLESSSSLAKITFATLSLPTIATATDFDFGNVAITSGTPYYITIERETSSTSLVKVLYGTSYSGGNAYWTYNSTGFDSAWDTGNTTIESSPSISASIHDNYDTKIREASATTNFSETSTTQIDANNLVPEYYKAIWRYPIEEQMVTSDENNFDLVRLFITSNPMTSETYAKRLLVETVLSEMTWNIAKTGTSWNVVGCNGAGTDFTETDKVDLYDGTTPGFHRSGRDLTAIADNWTLSADNNYGIVGSVEGLASTGVWTSTQYSANNGSQEPTWEVTSLTGSSDASRDIYFEILSTSSNPSTINYSKRFKPENFPTLNTFDIPGRIVGIAKSGGYLIVAGKNPDALHFYRFTGDVRDGNGLDFVTTVPDITFGSSKSIARLPTTDSFIFYSGSGVCLQNGLKTKPLSGKIREEAKGFQNHKDPEDFYSGSQDQMPQGGLLPTKDTYLLSVPNSESKNSYIYAYNYANDTWTRWTDLYATALVTRYSGGSTPTLYLGDQSGQVYTLDKTGSTTKEAVLSWFFSKQDITKDKTLRNIEIIARADNPLTGCVTTLEAYDVMTGTTYTSLTKNVADNTTTDKMVELPFMLNKTGREFKLTLRQKASSGALSLRSIRYSGDIIRRR